MPRGKSRATSTVKEQKEDASTVEQMSAAIRTQMDTALKLQGADARKRILDGADDILTRITDLALGIKLVNAEGGTYAIAPHWPSLKWLAEWYRQIIQEDAPKGGRQVHDIDNETKDLLRAFIQTTRRPVLPEPDDGVYRLEAAEYHRVEDDEDDENE